MLLRIDAEKIVLLLVMLGLVGIVGQAHARLNNCQTVDQRSLRCLLNLE